MNCDNWIWNKQKKGRTTSTGGRFGWLAGLPARWLGGWVAGIGVFRRVRGRRQGSREREKKEVWVGGWVGGCREEVVCV